uniref:Uncharacterized protein n=1 Tax=Sipha flava TaxID=143950 RepID=A0A2S2R417_9HEMI
MRTTRSRLVTCTEGTPLTKPSLLPYVRRWNNYIVHMILHWYRVYIIHLMLYVTTDHNTARGKRSQVREVRLLCTYTRKNVRASVILGFPKVYVGLSKTSRCTSAFDIMRCLLKYRLRVEKLTKTRPCRVFEKESNRHYSYDRSDVFINLGLDTNAVKSCVTAAQL